MQRKIILLLIIALCCGAVNARDYEAEYIVYMGAKGGVESHDLVASHHDILAGVLGSKRRAAESMIYTYKNGFSGFSARLTEQEADAISHRPNVVSVFRSRLIQLHTTRSWDFLGLVQAKEDLKRRVSAAPSGSYDTILGLLDTGLWPESESFNDAGFGPVPTRWKGFCNNTGIKNSSELFPCTKKLIGARSYPLSLSSSSSKARSSLLSGKIREQQDAEVDEFDNARDANGHGTHTSSTAAGIDVEGANMFGLAPGTARGGYSKARIAMYKVCWYGGTCSENAILAAIDDAIHDGVDAISLSVGGPPADYDEDGIAIGAYHAVEHGIVMTCSAGNSGPGAATVSNSAPWIITVGASTIDRSISSILQLGNNVSLIPGVGLNLDKPVKPSYTLLAGGNIPSNTSSSSEASRCLVGSLDASKLAGNIVVCILDLDAGLSLSELEGATGLVLISDFYADVLSSLSLRTTILTSAQGEKVLQYIKETKHATASILKTTTIPDVKPAPVVAGFSSRGPNSVGLDIIKPDVTAPGVNILAAWSAASLVAGVGGNETSVKFNIISGTSMSCPHVSGAVSYLKSIYPEWSPAAIKSALMTTASFKDNTGKPITDFNASAATPFEYGSGEIDPTKAADPGLVYDISPGDYAVYLCQAGYNSSRVQLITGNKTFTCPTEGIYLNYPSFSFLNISSSSSQKTMRTLTNVGGSSSSYSVEVAAPPGVSIAVEPAKLSFGSAGQKLGFTVSVKAEGSLTSGSWLFGSLTWAEDGGSRLVRSPVAVLAM